MIFQTALLKLAVNLIIYLFFKGSALVLFNPCFDLKSKRLSFSTIFLFNMNNYLKNHLENDKEMDIELMIDDFLLFFMAGSETSVSALCTIIYLLEKHPDILKKY